MAAGLRGTVALVTGASSGIGEAAARELAARTARRHHIVAGRAMGDSRASLSYLLSRSIGTLLGILAAGRAREARTGRRRR